MELDGCVALVTGASRGIGAAIAERLAKAGTNVAVGYGRDAAAAEEVAGKIMASGRRAVTARGEVEDPAKVAKMVDAVESKLGSIDILVSNAGIAPQQDLEEITTEDWDRVMNVNLRPAFLLAKRLAPGMRDRRWGRGIFVSSVAAFTGGRVGPQHTASKGG